MERRMLGTLEVSMVGLGCATMTPFYDQPDRDAATDTLESKGRFVGHDPFPFVRGPAVGLIGRAPPRPLFAAL